MELLDRHKKALAILKKKGSVSVNDLIQMLDVSPATIRRDLEFLEQKKLLLRTYGGATVYPSVGFEPKYTDRLSDCLAEKKAIARLAASLVEPGEIIAIDAGTTTSQIANLLFEIVPLTILTPSLTIAELFADNDCSDHTVILPGGIVRNKTHSLVGPLAEENIRNHRCNKAFLGCQAITSKDGAMNANLLAISTKRALVEISQKIIVVADHTKFSRTSLATIAALDKINVLITDSQTDESYLQPFRDSGITVMKAV